MPERARRPCRAPGCPVLTSTGVCDKHKDSERAARKQYDVNRSNDPLRKLYKTELWTRTRLYILTRDPLCRIGVLCDGRAPSTIADHIIAARIYCVSGGSFYEVSNLQGCCKRCHDHKTATEDSKFTGLHA